MAHVRQLDTKPCGTNKKTTQNRTRDKLRNHLADKTADRNEAIVEEIYSNVQWTTVEAITAVALLPTKGVLYRRVYRGQPKALYRIIDSIHEIRYCRYLKRRDTTNGTILYWQDNTIALAASIFNGSSKSSGYHAHTARMVYGKHWHGRNRLKNTKLICS